MLEYLRNEVFKIRGKNYLLRTDLNEMKEANHHLTEHSASVTASFEALKQHANQLSKTNMKLIVDTASQKEIIAKLKNQVKSTGYSTRTEVSKLREELKRQEMKHAEEIARLKKELGSKKVKQANKKDTQPKQESSSLKKYATFNRAIDGDDDWGQEYYSNSTHGKGKKRRFKGKLTNLSKETKKSGRGGNTGPGSKSGGGRGGSSLYRKSNPRRPNAGSTGSRPPSNSTNNSRAPAKAQSSLKSKSSLAAAKSSLAAAASDPRPSSISSPKLIASTRSLATPKKTSSLSKAAGK